VNSEKVIIQNNYSLRSYVEKMLTEYFSTLDNDVPVKLYDFVLQEVEAPLLSYVLRHTQWNQSAAAKILGLNRSTLRKKIKEYALD
jgi:Fis family transcriptional regulator